MKDRIKELQALGDTGGGKPSPLELVRMMGGRGHRVKSEKQRVPDSMLAVYKNRLTYTFILEGEVASIHFDVKKGEIYFRGHNIGLMELTEAQKKALYMLQSILEADPEGREYLSVYSATLGRLLADK